MVARLCATAVMSTLMSAQAASAALIVNYVSQDRFVRADANWPGGFSNPPDIQAPDFLPFSAGITAGGGSAFSQTFALALSSQTSSLGTDGNILFRGAVNVDLLADLGEFASAGGTSHLRVVVDVLSVGANQWGSFDASFSGLGFDSGTLSLTGPGVAINETFTPSNFGISGTFIVSPGQYELILSVSSGMSLSDGVFFQGGAGLIAAIGIPAPATIGVGTLATAAFLGRRRRARNT